MRKWLLLAFAMSFLTLSAQEKNEDVTRLLVYMKHAMLFNQSTPQEKTYLHFDNTGYFKGETMHFKAYVVRADNGKPTTISKVLYVELLNPSGDVVETRKLYIQNGESEGDIKLDSLFGTGFYEVRAFTRYMMNWGGNGVFSRVFPIFKKPAVEGAYDNPQIDDLSYTHRLPNGREDASEDNKNQKKAATNKGYTLHFYPEGGDLVTGLQSRVAFSVTDKEGKHVAVKGLVIDSSGETLAIAQSGADGRGTFVIRPDGKPLTFVVTDDKGKKHEYPLPQAKTEGCVLQMNAVGNPNAADDVLTATIQSSSSMQGRLLGYTIINGGAVVQCDTMKAEEVLQVEFDRSKMRAGVNQLTVFDSDGRIQAERLFFIIPKSNEADSIKVSVPETSLRPCGRVSLTLTAEPNSSVSFAAMDAATLTNGKVGNAMTWMLLGSEVKGYIENPDYYFEKDDQEHREAADLLMMVQGWRRYNWKLHSGQMKFEELEGNLGRIQPIEDKLYLFGKLKPDTNKWRKKHPVAGVSLNAFLYNQTGEHYQGSTVTDSVGGYAFELPNLKGEWEMFIRTKWNDKNAAYVVAIDRHFSPVGKTLSPYETEMIPLPEAFVKLKRTAGEQETEVEGRLKMSGTGKNVSYVLPTVKVKKRYFTDNSQLPWYDEKTGARKSTVYYNIDEATDRISDEGELTPTLYDWLLKKNEFFGGVEALDDKWMADENTGKLIDVRNSDTTITNYSQLVFKDGLSYKNRPIIWIVNNTYCTVTQYPERPTYTIRWKNNVSGATAMPDFIDEVKSVYISEDDDNYTKFVQADELSVFHPVTVFVYTHPQFFSKEKGIRRTHFQGFNEPEGFEMEDYSVMPAMEDFRRTLYWQPWVKIDANGQGRVEFFNNSSCKQMYISAEGITPSGKFIVSE